MSSTVVNTNFGSIQMENQNDGMIPGDTVWGHVHSFSFGHAWRYLAGTRCKPYDNRELDVLDGLKCLFFVFCTIA